MPSSVDLLNFAELVAESRQLRDTITEQVYAANAWATGSATGGPNGDGRYPFPVLGTPDSVLIPSLASLPFLASGDSEDLIYPDEFDPEAGSGPTHDDSDAIQSMFDEAAVSQRVPSLRPGVRYYLSRDIVGDPSRVGLNGQSAILDWRLKTFVDPATATELISNGSFDSGGTGWTAGSSQTFAPSFTGGQMVFAPPNLATNFLEQGQKVTAPAGSTLRISVEFQSITTTQDEEVVNTFRTVVVGVRNGSSPLGSAASVGASRTISNQQGNYAEPFTETWDVIITSANPWIRIQSNARNAIKSVSVKIVPNNTCLLLRTPPAAQGGRQRGHNYRDWRNFKIAGRSGQGPFVDAVVFDTPTADFSSRARFDNVDISDNVGRGLIFQNRAYLNLFVGCRVVCSEVGLTTLQGAADAGENITFIHGNFGGGKIGINNRGMDIRLISTSIDFTTQHFYKGLGNLYAYAPWFECYPVTAAGRYYIDVESGVVQLIGGRIQIDGAITTGVLDAPFRVADGALLKIDGTQCFNLGSTDDVWTVGDGRIEFGPSMMSGTVGCPTIKKRDARHSVWGPGGFFEGAQIDIPAWVSVPTGVVIDRYHASYSGQVTYTGNVAPGERVIVNVSPAPNPALVQGKLTSSGAGADARVASIQTFGAWGGDTAQGSNVISNLSPAPNSNILNRYIAGANIPIGARVIGYSTSAATITLDRSCTGAATNTYITAENIIVMTQPWNGPAASNASHTIRVATTAQAGMEISSAYCRSGTKSLRLFKSGSGAGTQALFNLAFPVRPGRKVGCEFWFMIPADGSAPGTNLQLYFNSDFCVVENGSDAAPPKVSLGSEPMTDQPFTYDRSVGVPWTRFAFDIMSNNPSAHDGWSPEWATDVRVVVNAFNAPGGWQMFIDDAIASTF